MVIRSHLLISSKKAIGCYLLKSIHDQHYLTSKNNKTLKSDKQFVQDLAFKQCERPVNRFCEWSLLGDVLALETALVLALIPELRGLHGSHGNYIGD